MFFDQKLTERPMTTPTDGPSPSIAQAASAGGRRDSHYFRRRANEWLILVRGRAREDGILPVPCGESRVDLPDGLRSELNVQNGAALSKVASARESEKRSPTGAESKAAREAADWRSSVRLQIYRWK